MYLSLYYIYIDMQQKLLSVIYMLKIAELLVKLALIMRVPERL